MCIGSKLRAGALNSTSVTCSESHEIFDGGQGLKLNHDYMSEMSKCNTARTAPFPDVTLLI